MAGLCGGSIRAVGEIGNTTLVTCHSSDMTCHYDQMVLYILPGRVCWYLVVLLALYDQMVPFRVGVFVLTDTQVLNILCNYFPFLAINSKNTTAAFFVRLPYHNW